MSKRVELISNHLSSRFPNSPLELDNTLEIWRNKGKEINQQVIEKHYFGKYLAYIKEVRKFMDANESFNHSKDIGLGLEEFRERGMQQLGEASRAFPLDFITNKENPLLKVNLIYALTEYEGSMSTKGSVQFNLYVDAMSQLGTEKHRPFIDRAYKLQDIGCFAMTELGHGSNVAKVETISTYQKSNRTFLINSPTHTSTKWWIGGAAKSATMSVVFAQLIIDNINHGVHCFLVPIRNKDHSPIAEVTIGDCGHKVGLNGIDNGFIRFNNYEVPYDSLLDNYSQITPEGKFKSSIKNKEKRFGIMLGGLTRGRCGVIVSCTSMIAQAVGVAIRYSATRRQFSLSGPEVPILSYQQHRFRLMPLLSQCFAVRAGYLLLQNMYELSNDTFLKEPEGEDLAEFHAILSGLKAVCSWIAVAAIQVCRECCGGLGYSHFSGLGRMRDGQEVNSTWEGDNSILIQQTGKYILKQIQKTMKGHKIFSPRLKFIKFPFEAKETKQILSDNLGFEELHGALENLINYLIFKSVSRLQENLEKHGNDSWNNTQTFFIADMSRLFIEYLLSVELLDMAKRVEKDCAATGKYFYMVAKLFTLGLVERNLGSLAEAGLDIRCFDKVRDGIIGLCDSLGDVSVAIVDSILASDKIIGSVVGTSDGQVYRKMIESVESLPEVYDAPYWLPVLNKIRGIAN